MHASLTDAGCAFGILKNWLSSVVGAGGAEAECRRVLFLKGVVIGEAHSARKT